MDSSRATAGGVLALVFWASTIGCSRVLVEHLGGMTAAAAIHVCAGLIGTVHMAASPDRMRSVRGLPGAYWVASGSLFLMYAVALYGAIASATDRAQVLEVGLVNYLWPSLTLAFSVPLIGAAARWTLAPGVALAFGGVVLAAVPEGAAPFDGLAQRVAAAPGAYALALAAAVAWGLYNPVSRRVARGMPGDGVPVFMLVTGGVLAGIAAARGERPVWSGAVVAPLAYMAVFPTWLAYGLWDAGMRRGNLVLLSSLSYLTPVASTVVTGWVLGVRPGARVWLACLLVISGAALCSRSVREPAPDAIRRGDRDH